MSSYIYCMTSYKIQGIFTDLIPKITNHANIKGSFNIAVFIISMLEMYFL